MDESTLHWVAQMMVADEGKLSGADQKALVAQAEKMLRVQASMVGEDEDANITILTSIGQTQIQRGEWAKAQKLYERALELSHKKWGAKNVNSLKILYYIAMSVEKQGDLISAEDLYGMTARGAKAVLGENHQLTLRALDSLALTIGKDDERIDEAKKLFRDVLARKEATFGKDHRQTLVTVHNLAVLPPAAEALPFAKRAAKGWEALLGAEHPNTLAAYENLACNLDEMKQVEEAEDLFRRAVKGCIERHGKNHPATVMAMWNLAKFLDEQKKFVEAAQLFRDVGTNAAAHRQDHDCRHIMSQDPEQKAAKCDMQQAWQKNAEDTAQPPLLQSTLCAVCGTAGATKCCGRCKAVVYCSRKCQRSHWKAHKKECGKPKPKPKEPEEPEETEEPEASVITREQVISIAKAHCGTPEDAEFLADLPAGKEGDKQYLCYFMAGDDDKLDPALLRWYHEHRGGSLAEYSPIGYTLLHLAAQTDNVEAIRWLHEKGADLDQPTGIGGLGMTTRATPLHIAVTYRQTKAIDALCELGAEVDKRNVAGRTPLLFASSNPCGNPNDRTWAEVIECLIRNGADKHAVSPKGANLADFVLDFDGFPDRETRAQMRWLEENGLEPSGKSTNLPPTNEPGAYATPYGGAGIPAWQGDAFLRSLEAHMAAHMGNRGHHSGAAAAADAGNRAAQKDLQDLGCPQQ